jgi:tetratricopeptide (TPR) repeat protein
VLLHLAAVLGKFWRYRGYNREAIEWLDLAVARAEATTSADRARALMWLGHFEWIAGRVERARPLVEDSVAQARAVDDGRLLGTALRILGYVEEADNRVKARRLTEEAVAVSRAVGYKRELAFALHALANHLLALGELEPVESLLIESLAVARESGDAIIQCEALCGLTWVSHRHGEVARARAMIEEGLALARQADVPWMVQFALLWLGDLAAAKRDLDGAMDRYREALRVEIDASRGMAAYALDRCAAIIAERGDRRRAACLFGVCANMPRTEVGEFLQFGHAAEVAQEMANVQRALGENEFATAWAEGQAMTPEQAIADALGED